MNDFWRELIQAGERLVAGANSPFLLHDPQSVWLVDRGAVDVFFIRLVKGQPAGTRRFVSSVAAGECLLGLSGMDQDSGWGLIGAGHLDTDVFRLDRHTFVDICGRHAALDALASLVERWVHALTRGISPPFTPREFMDIPVGREFPARRGEFVRPRSSVLWFRHVRGSSTYLSNANLLLHRQDPFIPLCRDIWMETKEEDNLVLARTTADCLARPEEVWAGLAALGDMVIECLVLDALERSEVELAKAQERQDLDQRQMAAVMEELASVLGRDAAAPTGGAGLASPLFLAAAMVGKQLGVEMKPAPPASRQTPGQDPLEDIGQVSQVRVRPVTLRGKWWRRENGPLLAFRKVDNHPLALLVARPGRYVLVDPETKVRKAVNAKTAATLSPSAFTIIRTFPRRSLKWKEVLAFTFRGSWPDARAMLQVGLLGGLLGMALPIAVGVVMDRTIPNAARGELFQLGIGLAAAAVAAMLFQIVSAIALIRLQTRMDSTLQAAVWDRLLELPLTFFRRYSVGDLAQRANGLGQIRQQLSGAAGSAILSGVFSVFNFALLFHYGPRLALVATVLVVLSVAVTTLAGYFNLKYQKQVMAIGGKVSGYVLQFITGIAKIRVAGAEMRSYAFWARLFSNQRRVIFRLDTFNNWFGVFNTVFSAVCTVAIYGFLALSFGPAEGSAASAGAALGGSAGAAFSGGALSTGSFIAFMAAFGQFLAAMTQLGGVMTQLLQLVPLCERALPILQTEPEVTLGQADPGELRGEIEVNSLSFRYDDNGPDILKNVTLRARPGEFVAIVGPSGSGKSTLIRLLLGFEKPRSGAVYFDGKDMAELDRRRLRRQFGVVLQNGRVLSGNVFDNIVGATRLTLDDAWDAARMAGLENDIKQMPMQMHTFITEGGGTLSGGQRQRLLIARALAFKPKIVLFDEATSALDNATQAVVGESLAKLDATRIVIAHRLSTVVNADRIYVMQDGAFVEQGNFEELMRADGVFARLARRQII